MCRWIAVLVVLFAAFQVADLVSTGLAGIGYEGNGIAAMAWDRYGFGVLVVGKLILFGVVYLMSKVIRFFCPIGALVYLTLNCGGYALVLVGNLRVLAAIL